MRRSCDSSLLLRPLDSAPNSPSQRATETPARWSKVGAFRMVLVALRSGAAFTESDQRGSVAL
jgi:hypothetical protein